MVAISPDAPPHPNAGAQASSVKKYRYFSTGPKQYLRKCRSYFWVPLNPWHFPGAGNSYDAAVTQVAGWLDEPEQRSTQFTDVFVVSHGWHRNLFAAAAAYDRLLGRVLVLLHTGRVTPRRPFKPLFLMLHWHSDPGQDAWLDKAGRRHKASFLQNARAIFDPVPGSPARATEDFETLFYLLSAMSSTPDYRSLMVDRQQLSAGKKLLTNYQIKEAVNPNAATTADKVTLLWMCYHEAQAKRPLAEQDESPGYGYLSLLQAVTALARFLISVLGITFVLGHLLSESFRNTVSAWASQLLSPIRLVWEKAGLGSLTVPGTLLLLLLASHGILLLAARAQKRERISKGPQKGLSYLAVASYAYMQIWCVLPYVIVSFGSFLFGGAFARNLHHRSLTAEHDERIGQRGIEPPPVVANGAITPVGNRLIRQHRGLSIHAFFAEWARLPIRLLRDALPHDSRFAPLVDLLDEQLAFLEMMRNGIVSGAQAADALVALYEKNAAGAANLQSARLHFIGHSFGSLVVSNTVRHLSHKMSKGTFSGRIENVCLMQGALSCNWFDGEEVLWSHVQGRIFNIYSRYDTANGFYYPLACYARRSAGHIGLRSPVVDRQGRPFPHGAVLKPTDANGREIKFVTLVRPPDLGAPASKFVNLDASRLIYEGAVASGGGHNDIFKDDVVHLLWAACEL